MRQLADLLSDQERCDYSVSTSLNESAWETRRKITRFFRDRQPDDFLLLYISTHGIKDESGNLYFAASDTSYEEIEATTIESSLVHQLRATCRARRQLLVLDSCFSGAFGRAFVPKDGQAVRKEDLTGVGREPLSDDTRGFVAFTASTSYQYSFESDIANNSNGPSLFTKHLIEGIRSGNADLDGDGIISEEELYRYVHERTRDERPTQTPMRWVLGAIGDMQVARTAGLSSVALPDGISYALVSGIRSIQLGALSELEKLALGRHKGYATAALKCLRQCAESDDSNEVRRMAAAILERTIPPESRSLPSQTNLAPSSPILQPSETAIADTSAILASPIRSPEAGNGGDPLPLADTRIEQSTVQIPPNARSQELPRPKPKPTSKTKPKARHGSSDDVAPLPVQADWPFPTGPAPRTVKAPPPSVQTPARRWLLTVLAVAPALIAIWSAVHWWNSASTGTVARQTAPAPPPDLRSGLEVSKAFDAKAAAERAAQQEVEAPVQSPTAGPKKIPAEQAGAKKRSAETTGTFNGLKMEASPGSETRKALNPHPAKAPVGADLPSELKIEVLPGMETSKAFDRKREQSSRGTGLAAELNPGDPNESPGLATSRAFDRELQRLRREGR